MVSTGGGRGGKRQIASDLNLVPFIDLFSTIVIFLLSVAVWDQLAAVPINLGAQDKATVEAPKQDIKKVTSNVKITMRMDSIEVFDEGKTQRFPKEGDKFNLAPIEQFVTDIRAKYVDKKDMLIFATDTVVYEDLVAVMDQCLGKEFNEIVITGLEQQM